jgi:hypothetical protein
MVNQDTFNEWCSNVLDKGVWGKDPTSGDSIHLPTCPYDLVNMDGSADAILNSCTLVLCYDLETKVAIEDRKGSKLMMALFTMLYRPSLCQNSRSLVRNLNEEEPTRGKLQHKTTQKKWGPKKKGPSKKYCNITKYVPVYGGRVISH